MRTIKKPQRKNTKNIGKETKRHQRNEIKNTNNKTRNVQQNGENNTTRKTKRGQPNGGKNIELPIKTNCARNDKNTMRTTPTNILSARELAKRKIICECGASYSKDNVANHCKFNRLHLEWLASRDNADANPTG